MSPSTYTWLNEALSQAAEYFNGYTENHENWMKSFLNKGYGGLSLTHWTSNNYGYGALFIRYLIDRFGEDKIKDICSSDLVGVKAVESVTGIDFNEIFNDFAIALVISGTGTSSDPKYNFSTLNLQSLQSSERGGLLPKSILPTGITLSNNNFAYRLRFSTWRGSVGSIIYDSPDDVYNLTCFQP